MIGGDRRVDLAIVGGGAAGLSLAAGAAQLGVSVLLAEAGEMGGDCLNVGCVPSKALIAAADHMAAARAAADFGVRVEAAQADWAAVRRHIDEVIAGIAPHDSVERFEGLGVDVRRATARFIGPKTLEVGGSKIEARRIVLATGSRPVIPPIPGLAEAALTNETIFSIGDLPSHLIVLGAGPIGLELAQAFRRLGSAVTVIERDRPLAKEDPDLAAAVLNGLRRDGVDIVCPATAARVEGRSGAAPDGVRVTLDGPDGRVIVGSHLLVALGRHGVHDALDLDRAGVRTDDAGKLILDAGLRTTNARVFAAGDAAGGAQFTHLAGHHAGVLVRRLLFRLPATAAPAALPRVTFTRPELAQVGLNAAEAEARYPGRVRVADWPFAENDRARTARQRDGLARIVLGPGGRVVGAGIVGAEAGEQIALWSLIVAKRLPARAVAGIVLPYPTLAETGKRAVGKSFEPTLFSDRTRRLVRWLRRLP